MAHIAPDELTTDDVSEGDTIKIRFHSRHFRHIITRDFTIVDVTSSYDGQVEEMQVRYHSTGKVYRLMNTDDGTIFNRNRRGEIYELGHIMDYPIDDEPAEQTTGNAATVTDGGDDKSDLSDGEPEQDDHDEIDAEAARELVAQEISELLKSGLSPSQALDYWATQDGNRTHGDFTQTDWSEIRERSQQAISDSVSKAQAQLDDFGEPT